jgi:hypothetical protein
MILPHVLERLVVLASDGRWAELLAELPDSAEIADESWSKLLVRLSFFGRTTWISPLLSRGADPRFKDEIGDTAMSECLSGSLRKRPTLCTFAALLQAGADPNEITRGGNRILHLAITEDRPEFAALLLLSGADPRLPAPDPDRPDAFRIARAAGPRWAGPMLDRWCIEYPDKAVQKLADPWGTQAE